MTCRPIKYHLDTVQNFLLLQVIIGLDRTVLSYVFRLIFRQAI